MAKTKQVRYGVVGLGHIAQVAVLPAFARVKANSLLTALVTGDPKKARTLSRKYKVPAVYSYEEFDQVLTSDVVDALYIALPNDQHVEYATRALKHGIHVLCEKPLATTEAECRKIDKAAHESGAKVMTAYRLHFDPANLKALELTRKGKLGQPRFFSSSFSYQIKDAKNIRLRRETGGGTVWDIGIYCLNAARMLFDAEPLEVFALAVHGKDKRFHEVEEMTSVTLRFPDDRLATFTCSFGADTSSHYEVVGTKGALRLDQAYEYTSPRKLHLFRDGEARQVFNFKKIDQFAAELDYFSKCVLKDLAIKPNADEGRRDVRVIEAIYKSVRTGKPISLHPEGHEGPSQDMAQEFAPHEEPETVDVQAPHA